ncbi:hypothetical protein V1L54_07430 [Streptomyces sp. TRM 70361]|uniref:hypothetical protein n=1 Tax=Streptomyces sp. TRM 70361 TaxID=3116553 RepID=UPI002E7B1E4A|nr:hypothetical protein [Streptomyces sp. TRM 70361]MEE1939244.1 hypothetical protein [Streptomyces sp. TRM 70361]
MLRTLRGKRARPGAVALALAAALTVLTAGPGLRAEAADVSAAGPVGVVEYDLGDEVFTDPSNWHGVSEVRAVVHYPRAVDGRLPVVVLMHGQQLPCHSPREEDWDWPCPPGVDPYPSHRGYDYLADALARDGYVVVAPNANGLNHHMGVAPQRARLINRHLELLGQFSETGGGPLAGRFTDARTGEPTTPGLRHRLDLDRVGTMGHSVAGEAVMYQAADGNRDELPDGVRIRGAVSLASPGPSTFFDTLVTGAPLAVISTGCWSLGNESYFEDARGHSGANGFLLRLVKGNHNYFNTEWTAGPEPSGGDDTDCPETAGRPTPEQQQSLLVTYLRAFYAYSLKGDRSVLPVLTDAGRFPGVDTETDSY